MFIISACFVKPIQDKMVIWMPAQMNTLSWKNNVRNYTRMKYCQSLHTWLETKIFSVAPETHFDFQVCLGLRGWKVGRGDRWGEYIRSHTNKNKMKDAFFDQWVNCFLWNQMWWLVWALKIRCTVTRLRKTTLQFSIKFFSVLQWSSQSPGLLAECGLILFWPPQQFKVWTLEQQQHEITKCRPGIWIWMPACNHEQ